MLNVETLKIICDLVELRNFSRTAEKHGVSQSAVSQQLAQLEIMHKCQFVDRKKRPLELTQAGQIFYLSCKDMLDRYNRMVNDLAVLGRSTAKINIAAIFSIGMHTLQPYVKKFMAKYPMVTLRIQYCSAGEIYDRVLRGDVDIGIVAVAKKMRNIDVYPFENEPLMLVCSPGSVLSSFATVAMHRLQGMDFIAFDEGIPSRILIDTIFEHYGIKPRITLEFDNIETIKRAVEIGAGVSILPATTVRAELASGTLKAIKFAEETFYRPTNVILRKNKMLAEAGRYLLELLQKQSRPENVA